MPDTPDANGSDDRTTVGATPIPPKALCNVLEMAARPDEFSGVLWKLTESGRQLDANLVRLRAGQHIDSHAEHDLDVMLLVISGGGTLGGETGPRRLDPGTLIWLEHGCRRDITADQEGLCYLTVHRRRPGMRIGWRAAPERAKP